MSEQVPISGQAGGVTIEGTLTVTYPESIAPPAKSWEFKALFCRDEEFAAGYAALQTMGLNVMECAAFSGSANAQLLNRLNQIKDPFLGWILFGSGFKPSAAGGSFGISDAKLDALMTNNGQGEVIRDHPRNSHRYQIADEINLTKDPATSKPFTADQLKANLQTIKARVDRVKSHDPAAIVNVTDYRREQLDPASNPGAIWKGQVDEVWLDGYPNWIPYQETYISDQAHWCDQAGVSYLAVSSCHEYNSNQPCYPTPETFDKMVDQWWATAANGFGLYTWNDGSGKGLYSDTGMQTHIGEKLNSL